jgi:hypothetical protein
VSAQIAAEADGRSQAKSWHAIAVADLHRGAKLFPKADGHVQRAGKNLSLKVANRHTLQPRSREQVYSPEVIKYKTSIGNIGGMQVRFDRAFGRHTARASNPEQ